MRISDWSSDVCSSDLFNYPREIRITRGVGPGGYLRASVIGGETTLVVIDGIPVLMYNYHLIPSIPPSEVKSVEIIKFAKNFSRLYMEAVPNANPMEIPATGSVIAIYTYGRRGIFGVQKPRRTEERSVGKECVSKCRSGGWPDHKKKKKHNKKSD